MSMSDPIADMLTRIRNALHSRKNEVEMPSSKSKVAIAKVLQEEGYIDGFEINGGGATKTLRVELKYFEGAPVIEEIRRVSRPGCRVYKGSDEIPSVRAGLGIAMVSTSKGVMTDKSARQQNIGGEILCTVF